MAWAGRSHTVQHQQQIVFAGMSVNLQKVGAVALMVLSVVQLAAVWVICDSAVIMQGEWSRQSKKYLAKLEGIVVRSRPMWGLVRVYLLDDCHRVGYVDQKLDEYKQEHDLPGGYCIAKNSQAHSFFWNVGGYAAAKSAVDHHKMHSRHGKGRQLRHEAEDASAEFHTEGSKFSKRAAVSDAANETVANKKHRPHVEIHQLHQALQDSWLPNMNTDVVAYNLPCRKGNIYFQKVRWLDSYLSLETFTRTAERLFHFDTDPLDYREHCFRYLRLYVVVCLLIKYMSKCVQALQNSRWFGLIRNTRSMFDRNLESALLHGMTSMFCITLQVSLCTCFLVVYRLDHALVTYLPMFAFDCYFWCFVIFAFANELDKYTEWSKRLCTYRKNCIFWCAWGLFMMLLAIPLMATAGYNIQFLWLVARCQWAEEDLEIISDQFYYAVWKGSLACWVCILQAILEQLLFLALDCYVDKESKAPVAKELIQAPYDIIQALEITGGKALEELRHDLPLVG